MAQTCIKTPHSIVQLFNSRSKCVCINSFLNKLVTALNYLGALGLNISDALITIS